MNPKTIITIGRQYGSGGHEIGKKLAGRMGIPFYDRELLEAAAKDSGIRQELIENYDEMPTNSLLYSLSMGAYSLGSPGTAYMNLPIHHKIFLAQLNAIKKISEQGGCVIVGRCADYALADYPHCVNVFVYAGEEARIRRITALHGLTRKEAADAIARIDKKRASYYNFYSNKKWSAADSYHLCVDSGAIGVDNAVEIICRFADMKEPAE